MLTKVNVVIFQCLWRHGFRFQPQKISIVCLIWTCASYFGKCCAIYGTTVALENGHLPTTWQESELMLRNTGLLHHNVIIAAGLTVLSAMLENTFSTSTCCAIFELIKFICFGSTLSYPYKEFLILCPPCTRTKFNPRPSRTGTHSQCGLTRPRRTLVPYGQCRIKVARDP